MREHLLKPGLFLASAGLVGAVACQSQAPPDHAAGLSPLVETFIVVWNSGDYDRLDAVMSPDFRRRTPRGTSDADNLAEMKEVMGQFRTAYPDAQVKLNESHYMENLSFHEWTFTGTNTGAGEMPPTGNRVEVSGLSLLRYADGRIVEELVQFDTFDLMEQLGFTLAPPEGGEESGE